MASLPPNFPNYWQNPKLLQHFSLPFSPPPSSALNNFCWCSENWWWCCACCSNQVRLEFMLKSHLPFYKLDVGSRSEKWGEGRKGVDKIWMFAEKQWFFEVNDGATEPCTHKLNVYASRCVCIDDRKIEGSRRLGHEWKRREYPNQSFDKRFSMRIDCVWEFIYIWDAKKDRGEVFFFASSSTLHCYCARRYSGEGG